jgi:hypothetical protein
MPTLRLVPTSGSPHEVSKDQTLVGREPGCDLTVPDGSVSRKHARLELRGDSWFVVDQASANGTFVDSQRISEAALRSGQELRFGAVAFRVEIEGEPDLGATIGPEEGATVIQPMLAASPAAPKPTPSPAPPPPPPPAPPRVAPPPAAMTSPIPTVPPPSRASAGPGAPPAPPAAKGGKSPVFWIGTGCCGCLTLVALILTLILGGVYCGTREPVKIIDAQLTEIKGGSLDAAYARFSDSYKARLSPEDFAALVAAHPTLRNNAGATFLRRSVENSTATVGGTLKASSGESEEVTYELSKEDGVWRITGIHFAGDVTIPTGGSPETGSPSYADSGALDVQTAGLEKENKGTVYAVTIHLSVSGLATRPTGGRHMIDVVQDLETLGPDGRTISSLSQNDLQKLSEASPTPNASATFTTNLTVPTAFGEGTYTARFTIRDLAGNTRKDHEVSFSLP